LVVAALLAVAVWGTLLAVESSGQSSGLKDRPVAVQRDVAQPNRAAEPRADGPIPFNCTPPDCRPPSPGGGNGPAIVINDVCVAEGNSGTRNLNFVVSRVVQQNGSASVDFRTRAGTASSPSDYTFKQGTLHFTPGQANKTVSVAVHGDKTKEPDETFRLALSNAHGAILADVSGTGTILNDDGGPVGPCPDRRPGVKVLDACTVEGTGTTKQMQFNLVRSGDLSGESSMNFGTRNGTAVAPADFITKFGTFRFQTGQTQKFARIDIVGDNKPEATEQFQFFLFHPVAFRATKGVATGTILDNDSGPIKRCPTTGGGGAPSLRITDARITEGDSGTKWLRFDITLSHQSAKVVKVHFGTVPGTAHRTTDYGFKQGYFTFQPGQTAKLTRIKIIGDTTREPNEQFTVRLDHATNATIADAVGVGTIINDD
jgi:chitinase